MSEPLTREEREAARAWIAASMARHLSLDEAMVLSRLIDDLERVEKERDELREQCVRLRTACGAGASDLTEIGKACGIRDDEYVLQAVMRVVNERDEARAKLARLVNATESFMRMGWETEERPRAKLLEILALAKGDK